jgi:hypothetical protein
MRDRVLRQIENVPVLGRIDAHELADMIIDRVISELMRHPYIRSRCCREWAVALADTRARIAEQIHRRIHGHVRIDDVLHVLEMERVS